jgi:nucleotide-binding universal stress UspA family protein
MSGSMDPFQASLDTYNTAEQEHQIAQRNKMLPKLRTAEEELLKSGFSKDRVDSVIMKSHQSRSEGLMEEAKDKGFGTIMVGRRGHSIVEEFFLGRVGDKLVQLAEDRAVWIVH